MAGWVVHHRRTRRQQLAGEFVFGAQQLAVVAFLLERVDDDTRMELVRLQMFVPGSEKRVRQWPAMSQNTDTLAAGHVPHTSATVIRTCLIKMQRKNAVGNGIFFIIDRVCVFFFLWAHRLVNGSRQLIRSGMWRLSHGRGTFSLTPFRPPFVRHCGMDPINLFGKSFPRANRRSNFLRRGRPQLNVMAEKKWRFGISFCREREREISWNRSQWHINLPHWIGCWTTFDRYWDRGFCKFDPMIRKIPTAGSEILSHGDQSQVGNGQTRLSLAHIPEINNKRWWWAINQSGKTVPSLTLVCKTVSKLQSRTRPPALINREESPVNFTSETFW